MRFPSRSQNPKIARFLFVALLAVGVGVGTGCEDKHIGRPCILGVAEADGGASTTTTTITSPALECPSRICLRESATTAQDPDKGLCTATCSSDDDCDGESTVCKGGFTCTWPTTVGPFCCQKMCVCRDFLGVIPPGGFPKPPVCDPAVSTCVNVH